MRTILVTKNILFSSRHAKDAPSERGQKLSESQIIRLKRSIFSRMIPRHCGDVGVAEVSFKLTEKNLREHFTGRRSYTRTKFYAVTNGDDWAVIEVSKKITKKLFQSVESIKVLSLPDRTRFVHEPELDVLDIRNLLDVQHRNKGKLVVFKGRFEHVSFVDVKLPAKVRVIDVVPPNPPKLDVLIKELAGKNSLLKIDTEVIDIAEMIAGKERDAMLPCRASYEGMSKRSKWKYLDQAPTLSEGQVRSSLLVGCPLSARIFEEIYGSKPKLANICARETVEVGARDPPTISRCCRVKEGVEVDGRMIIVPWGANICEVAEALRIALGML